MDSELEPIAVETIPMDLGERERPALRRHQVVAGGLALVLLTAGGLAILTGRAGGRPPEEAMAALRSFLSEATSAHLDGTVEGDGAETVFPVRFEVDVILPAQGHWISQDRHSTSEGVAVEGGAYYRAAPSRAVLDTRRWRWRDLPDEPAALQNPGIDSLLSFVAGVPLGLHGLDFVALRHMVDGVESVEAIGGGVYRGRVTRQTPPEGAPAIFGFGHSGTAEFTVADGGRLERAVWRLSAEGWPNITLDIRFSRWDEPLPLTVPGIDDVDPTPEIDEEAVAAFEAAPLLAPETLPEGWILLGAYLDEHLDRDGKIVHDGWESPCPALSLWYQPAFDPRAASRAGAGEEYLRFLELTESTATCRESETDIRESLPNGGEEGVQKTITVTVGVTRVQATSHFSEQDLRRILDQLVPLDLATQPTQQSVPPAG